MLLKNINIEEKLKREKCKAPISESILKEFYTILEKDANDDARVIKNTKKKVITHVNKFNLDHLESDNIFHINQIKEICINYRLRFLDANYFKGDIPESAISKIKKLEQLHHIEIKNFKIIAPSKLFKLKDKDDPLLFAPIGNDYFYLIHKWGNDLHPLRKFLMWPFKNIVNLIVVVLVISYLVTLMIPEGLFSKSNTSAEFFIMNFFVFKTLAAIVIYYSFAQSKNFNPAIWNSKYFN
tara:strand:- start:77712 stop:78428 length:717 start_codon:yes stop_codon:yes gene_type:complete